MLKCRPVIKEDLTSDGVSFFVSMAAAAAIFIVLDFAVKLTLENDLLWVWGVIPIGLLCWWAWRVKKRCEALKLGIDNPYKID